MRALRFTEFGSVQNLALTDLPDPTADESTAVVRVVAASINPSDVKNVEGKMEHSSVPRVPGRDYAGVVVAGPAEWVGAAVWGTGGEIGYTIDGSHAELIAVPIESLSKKPENLSFAEAATVGVTYLAAWLGLVEYAKLAKGETVAIIGVAGGVGSSAARIARSRGARVIGVDRSTPAPGSPLLGTLDGFVEATAEGLPTHIRDLTNGLGADVIFDAVGGPMFEPALKSLAHRGRLTEISSAGDRRVSFDLLDFYHNESQLFGADTRHRNAIQSKWLLEQLKPGFASGAFAAPGIDQVIALADGVNAYARLARGEARGRLVLAYDPSAV